MRADGAADAASDAAALHCVHFICNLSRSTVTTLQQDATARHTQAVATRSTVSAASVVRQRAKIAVATVLLRSCCALDRPREQTCYARHVRYRVRTGTTQTSPIFHRTIDHFWRCRKSHDVAMHPHEALISPMHALAGRSPTGSRFYRV